MKIYKKNAIFLLKFLILIYAFIFSIKYFILKDNPLPLIKEIVRGNLDKLPYKPILLYDYFLYMTLAFTFLPLPTIPMVILMGKTFSPLYVSIIGALATTLANLNDYCIVSSFFISKKIQKIHYTKLYKFLSYYFNKFPFIILTIGSFIPISIDFIRLLAIANQYPILKFCLANFLGRLPRYLILAALGFAFQLSNKGILFFFIIILLITLFIKIIDNYKTNMQIRSIADKN